MAALAGGFASVSVVDSANNSICTSLKKRRVIISPLSQTKLYIR